MKQTFKKICTKQIVFSRKQMTDWQVPLRQKTSKKYTLPMHCLMCNLLVSLVVVRLFL